MLKKLDKWLVICSLILLVIGLVMGSEMINTAIEAIVDLKTLKDHPLAKIAKDAAAGAFMCLAVSFFA